MRPTNSHVTSLELKFTFLQNPLDNSVVLGGPATQCSNMMLQRQCSPGLISRFGSFSSTPSICSRWAYATKHCAPPLQHLILHHINFSKANFAAGPEFPKGCKPSLIEVPLFPGGPRAATLVSVTTMFFFVTVSFPVSLSRLSFLKSEICWAELSSDPSLPST